MAAANSSRSSISPVATVACSQKVRCSPHSNTAKTGPTQASGPVNRACGPRSRCRASRVRSNGNTATARASNPSVRAASPAVSTFRATGITAPGSSFRGQVARNQSGPLNWGESSQPATRATHGRLVRCSQRLSVTKNRPSAAAATSHGSRDRLNAGGRRSELSIAVDWRST